MVMRRRLILSQLRMGMDLSHFEVAIMTPKKDCIYSSQGSVCMVHNAMVSINHDTSTVTIKNVSTDIGHSWNGGSFTYPAKLNTTAYFVPHTKAHTETREFTLKELLQLVVDNHISA